MKEIKAIIQPFMLEKVIKALHEIEGLPGCTVSTIQGYGRIGKSKGIEPNLGSTERTKLEIVIEDSLVDQVVVVIQKSAHTGNAGDGKIFVIEAVDAVSIRTGKRGEKAL
jgi:nitrogen regulatory protein P-II 1